ncbi:fam-a protein [Plasmodium yoelii]|uniref:Fam-a protein n=1 Tax=Plasmodium yoelii TaxID=5861 RepID=A0A077X7E7_PLAYE|nr:fam-a protein [Plasmodium yoelii]
MNKGYIKIALALLSLAGYTQNVAFASEHDADVTIKANPARKKLLFEDFPELVCEDIDEALVAMKHAIDDSELLIKLSETYSKVLKKLWDFNHNKKPYKKFINGNLARVYSKYLILLEKFNTDLNYTPLTKNYALAAKVKKSNDTTVIICPSRPLNYLGQIDDETDMKEMLENTQSIETDIDPEEALTKLGTNIAGFVVKKGDDNVQVTYINAIYDSSNSTDFTNDKKERGLAYTNILSLAQRI